MSLLGLRRIVYFLYHFLLILDKIETNFAKYRYIYNYYVYNLVYTYISLNSLLRMSLADSDYF